MTEKPPVLDGLRVASPCTVSWESMAGDDRVRHCGACRLNVYNLSAMSRREAEELVGAREGRLCVRFFRRADGTVLTKDCPVGIRAVRRRLALAGGAVAAMFFALLAAGCGRPAGGGGPGPVAVPGAGAGGGGGGVAPPAVNPAPPTPTTGRVVDPRQIMGDVADPRPLQGEASVPTGGRR